jgi:F420-non-reducing hydrogenase small subunit
MNRFLSYLKEHKEFHKISTVCDTCPRIRGEKKMTRVLREHEGIPNQSDCFIEQGYLCMGPITKAGCGAQCINVNAPCSGCYGQTEYDVDQALRFANIVTQQFNLGLSKEELLKQVKDPIGIFEKFTLAKNKNYQ